MSQLAPADAMVSIAPEDEESMARPTERSRIFGEQRRGSKYVAEAVELAGGGGFTGRFAAPGYELTDVEGADGQRLIFPDAEAAELAAARVLVTLLTKRSNQLSFEKNDKYRRMTPAEFAEGLADVGITGELFAHIKGTDPSRVRGWIEGTQDIPHDVRILIELMKLPGGIDVAEKTADAVATARRDDR